MSRKSRTASYLTMRHIWHDIGMPLEADRTTAAVTVHKTEVTFGHVASDLREQTDRQTYS